MKFWLFKEPLRITATVTFESAVALVDIVHDGDSVRTTMSPIGVSLDLKALAKIQSKSELVQLKQQAKIDAVTKGKTRFSPGSSKDFIFVMWDLPPELEQSAIYVAFRAGRGTNARDCIWYAGGHELLIITILVVLIFASRL